MTTPTMRPAARRSNLDRNQRRRPARFLYGQHGRQEPGGDHDQAPHGQSRSCAGISGQALHRHLRLSDRFDAHLDETGIWLSLHRTGTDDLRKTVRMHFRYGLFADILSDLAKTVNSMPASDRDHRTTLRDATQALYTALQAADQNNPDETSAPTANEEVRLLHIME
jgi:hypothetical protein